MLAASYSWAGSLVRPLGRPAPVPPSTLGPKYCKGPKGTRDLVLHNALGTRFRELVPQALSISFISPTTTAHYCKSHPVRKTKMQTRPPKAKDWLSLPQPLLSEPLSLFRSHTLHNYASRPLMPSPQVHTALGKETGIVGFAYCFLVSISSFPFPNRTLNSQPGDLSEIDLTLSLISRNEP